MSSSLDFSPLFVDIPQRRADFLSLYMYTILDRVIFPCQFYSSILSLIKILSRIWSVHEFFHGFR